MIKNLLQDPPIRAFAAAEGTTNLEELSSRTLNGEPQLFMATLKKLVQNLSLITAAICVSGISAMPVLAITLNGRLEHNQNQSQDENNQGTRGATAPNLQTSPAAPAVSYTDPNTFPKAYQGTWVCQTTVIDSSAPAVVAGQTIESEVSFYQAAGGRIKARWNQSGWAETQAIASTFGKNNEEAKSDRTTYFYGDNNSGAWAARARDQFALTAPDTISAKSYVDQYIDGQYAGRYRTVSVLKRTSLDPTIANNN